jgi:hypothetical protein
MKNETKYGDLKKYLGSEHKAINRYLRKGIRNDEQLEKVISEINLSLDTAIAFNNSIVHHCGFIGAASVKELVIYFKKKVGQNILLPNFLSTTKNADINFKGQDKVFEIHTCANSNGKDVTTLKFDKSPEEEEVTFKNGTYFNISEVKPDLIILKELTEKPEEYEILGEDYFMQDEEVRECFAKEVQVQDYKTVKSSTDQGLI